MRGDVAHAAVHRLVRTSALDPQVRRHSEVGGKTLACVFRVCALQSCQDRPALYAHHLAYQIVPRASLQNAGVVKLENKPARLLTTACTADWRGPSSSAWWLRCLGVMVEGPASVMVPRELRPALHLHHKCWPDRCWPRRVLPQHVLPHVEAGTGAA